MHQTMLELTGNVDRAACRLKTEYLPNELYAFRTNSRRIRSILKHIDSHRSRGYRKTWGGFAAVTNDARDWDVFLETSEELLTSEEFNQFRQLNREQIQHSHDACVEMLKTMHWRRHLEEWVHYLEGAEEEIPEAREQTAALDQALANAQTVLEKAMLINDDHTWHKFRIAVKEVRYVADASRGNPETEQYLAKLITSCKQLQSLLGDWHDTVVQLNMLDELDAAPVHSRLREIISGRKQLFLKSTRELLAGHPLFAQLPT